MANIKFDTVVGGPIGTNCYIVYNDETKEAVLIDPGVEMGRLELKVDKLQVKPVAILLTHGHADHIMCCVDAAKRYDAKVYMHEDEKELAKDVTMNCSAEMYNMGVFPEQYTVVADEYVKSNQELDLIGTNIKVIHTPGHTQGGCCYYVEEAAFLFCGDTLFMESVGRTDFPTGNTALLIRSLRDKLFVLPENVKAFPGHGPATSIGYEKKYNPYA